VEGGHIGWEVGALDSGRERRCVRWQEGVLDNRRCVVWQEGALDSRRHVRRQKSVLDSRKAR
jgi:hypothetical protein